MRRGSAQAGFTLVEMLVSLALLGTASLLMVEGFSASRGAWRRLQTREETADAVATAEMRLRNRLEQMTPRARFELATPYVDVDGAVDHLDFQSEPAFGERPAQALRRSLLLTGDGDLALADISQDGEVATQRPASDILLHHVAGLEIGYFGPQGATGATAWRDDWSRQPAPPELVRVRVRFPEGDRRSWPELIVRPAARVDGDCVIDADTAACRGRT